MGSYVSRDLATATGSGIPGLGGANGFSVEAGYSTQSPIGTSSDLGFTIGAEECDSGGLHPPCGLPLVHEDETGCSPGENVEEDEVEDDRVSCVFTWPHGGQNVYLTGSFNSWSVESKIQMVRTGHEFITVYELARGRHLYKFIVDGVWKYAPDQQTTQDANGNINNVIDATDHKRFNFRINPDTSLVGLGYPNAFFVSPFGDHTVNHFLGCNRHLPPVHPGCFRIHVGRPIHPNPFQQNCLPCNRPAPKAYGAAA